MIDLEIALARSLNWSLWEIDETDVESLLGFVSRLTLTQNKPNSMAGNRVTAAQYKTYCDRVDWL